MSLILSINSHIYQYWQWTKKNNEVHYIMLFVSSCLSQLFGLRARKENAICGIDSVGQNFEA